MDGRRAASRSIPLATSWALVTFAALWLLPTAAAHIGGGGELVETRFSVPPWVLWAAGGLVVAGSFMLVAAFQRKDGGTRRLPEPRAWEPDEGLPSVSGGPALTPGQLTLTRAIGMLGWILAVMPWFLPFIHPTPRPDTLFWTLVWVAAPIAVVVFGDIWSWFDPMRTFGGWIRRTRSEPILDVPTTALGAIGLGILLVIVATEIVWASYAASGIPGLLGRFASDIGDLTAGAIVLYTVLNVGAMFLFGAERWLTHGEAIGRFFRTWSLISMRVETERGVRWGLPGWHTGRSLTGCAGPEFVLVMLAAVNFDSLAHSAWGVALADLVSAGADASSTWVLLLGMAALFVSTWHVTMRKLQARAEDLDARGAISYTFVPILLPIAFGYHLAHNLEQSISGLPRFFPPSWVGDVAVDGIAWGESMGTFWALFQLVAILGGHLVAVLVSRDVATQRYASRIQAFRAEIPLTIVMVVYTLIGLALVGAPAAGGAA